MRANDVPFAIVAAVVLVLLTVFVPIESLRPDLPASLPPLGFDPGAVVAFHARAPSATPPRVIDESFDAIAAAQERHDALGVQLAQRTFASLLVDVAGDRPDARAAVREHQLRRMLVALASGRTDEPIVRLAARHGLVGALAPPWVSRATLEAWFDLRWESLAARETLRSERVEPERLAERLPAEERRAIVAWALSSDCSVLLGLLPAPRALDADALERCHRSRQQWIGLAATLDRAYPVDEARAASVVLHARELLGASRESADPGRRAELDTASREAFGEANLRYHALCSVDPSRRLRRYLRGTAQASGNSE